MKNSLTISVVIPFSGHLSMLKNCLQGLQKQEIDSPYEIIVVVDSISTSVVEYINSVSNVRLIQSKGALNPGGARNLGVDKAHGQYIAFIDADCVPEARWLNTALSALKSGEILVGGPVLDAINSNFISIADNILQFTDFSSNRPDGIASYLPTCNLAMKRTTFYEIGGFREDLPVGEDGVFCIKAISKWPKGLRFNRGMIVRHLGRTSMRAFLRHQEVFGFYRGYLGLYLSPLLQRLGSMMITIIPVLWRRFSYILYRTVEWNLNGLQRVFLVLPLLMLGLISWAKGFCLGCLMALRR